MIHSLAMKPLVSHSNDLKPLPEKSTCPGASEEVDEHDDEGLGGPILPHSNASSLQTAAGIRSTPAALRLIPEQDTLETRADYMLQVFPCSLFNIWVSLWTCKHCKLWEEQQHSIVCYCSLCIWDTPIINWVQIEFAYDTNYSFIHLFAYFK